MTLIKLIRAAQIVFLVIIPKKLIHAHGTNVKTQAAPAIHCERTIDSFSL